jgi:hypothetical protein
MSGKSTSPIQKRGSMDFTSIDNPLFDTARLQIPNKQTLS